MKKIFTNNCIIKKIAIVLVVLLLCQFLVGTPVHASDDENSWGGKLINSILKLFVSLCDGIQGLINKVLTGQKDAGVFIDANKNFWDWVLIGLAIAFTVAVIAFGVIATIFSGGTGSIAFVTVLTAVGKTLLANVTTFMVIAGTTAVGIFLNHTLNTDNTLFLSAVSADPYAIFSGQILAFDVDFFNPASDDTVKTGDSSAGTIELEKVPWDSNATRGMGEEAAKMLNEKGSPRKQGINEEEYFKNVENELSEYLEKVGYKGEKDLQSILNNSEKIKEESCSLGQGMGGKPTFEDVYKLTFEIDTKKYEITIHKGKEKTERYVATSGNPLHIHLQAKKYDLETKKLKSTAREITPLVSKWYVTLRTLALVGLMTVLVYTGIRIVISSAVEEKAKYKQMLMDWLVAMCLLFLLHYIMAFSNTIVKKITNVVSSAQLLQLEKDENNKYTIGANGGVNSNSLIKTGNGDAKDPDDNVEIKGFAIDVFTITDKELVKKAYETIVEKEDGERNEYYYSFFVMDDNGEPEAIKYPVGNFTEFARMMGQNLYGEQPPMVSAGYNLIYVVLVIMTVVFVFQYSRRVIYMAFLTIIAPLVALTYPIDRMRDGKSQGFNMWLKEYVFNLLIQPVHLIIYVVLIGSALRFAAQNIIYTCVALGFMVPAEKLLRRLFGFEKAKTPGIFAGPVGAGLMMGGISKLAGIGMFRGKPPAGAIGPGKAGGRDSIEEEETEETSTPTKMKDDAINAAVASMAENRRSNNNKNTIVNETSPTGYRDKLGQSLRVVRDENGNILHFIDQNGKILYEAIDSKGNPIPINTRYGVRNNPQQTPRQTEIPKNRRTIRSGITRAGRYYGRGVKQKIANRINARTQGKDIIGVMGSGVRRAGRIGLGIAGAATLGTAGAIAGITTGDPTKMAQFTAAGVGAGVATRNLIKPGTGKSDLYVEGTIDQFERGRLGKEGYEQKLDEKQAKMLRKNDKLISKVEEKTNIPRKEIPERLEQARQLCKAKGMKNGEEASERDMLNIVLMSEGEGIPMEEAAERRAVANMMKKPLSSMTKDERDVAANIIGETVFNLKDENNNNISKEQANGIIQQIMIDASVSFKYDV